MFSAFCVPSWASAGYSWCIGASKDQLGAVCCKARRGESELMASRLPVQLVLKGLLLGRGAALASHVHGPDYSRLKG